jgi:hypothetical protein
MATLEAFQKFARRYVPTAMQDEVDERARPPLAE